MHMSDALISPAVGTVFLAISGGLIAWSARKIKEDTETFKTPLMAVTCAFIFAAQMINFTIPGTGSSGHIGGGLLLAILLGPYRAFLGLASILVLQCLFFADGGLMALGCNIFNIAFFPAFVAYPLIFKPLAGNMKSKSRLFSASLLGALIGLLLGSFSVVIETVVSGITDLPFRSFLFFMMPIHLLIGLMEGLVVYGILSFVIRFQPSILSDNKEQPERKTLAIIMIIALILSGILSWFISTNPDGLEWSVQKVTGKAPVATQATYSFKILGSIIVIIFMSCLGFLLRRTNHTHGHQ